MEQALKAVEMRQAQWQNRPKTSNRATTLLLLLCIIILGIISIIEAIHDGVLIKTFVS